MQTYNYNCILVDDEEQHLNNLEELIEQFNLLNKRAVFLNIKAKYKDISLLINRLGEDNKIDIVFLDLRFYENFNIGENFLRIVKPNKDTKFVIVSNYIREGLKEALHKPEIIGFIEKDKIEETLQDVIESFWIKKEGLRAVFSDTSVKFYNNDWTDINYDQILYISSERQQVQIFLLDTTMIVMSANFISLNDFQGRGNLIRISKSKIINKNQVLDVHQSKDPIYNTNFLRVQMKGVSEIFKVGDQHESSVALINKNLNNLSPDSNTL